MVSAIARRIVFPLTWGLLVADVSAQDAPCWRRPRLDVFAAGAARQVDTVPNNDHALLAWVVPDYVRALARDAKQSGDAKVYDEVRRYVLRILITTDRARGVRDFTGTSRSVWGTFRNSTDST